MKGNSFFYELFRLNPSGVQSYGDAQCDVGDIDGDGWLDLVILDSLGLRFYKNKANENNFLFEYQSCWENSINHTFPSLQSIPTLIDLNGDNLADFIFPDHITQTIKYWQNTGHNDPRWVEADSVFQNVTASKFFASGDLDQDGDVDGITYIDNKLYIYWNSGTIHTPQWQSEPAPFNLDVYNNKPENIRFHDLNGDGFQDIILSFQWGGHNQDGLVIVGTNKCNADSIIFNFPRSVNAQIPNVYGITISIGDINRDGQPELLSGHGIPFIYLWNLDFNPDKFSLSQIGVLGLPFGFMQTGLSVWDNNGDKELMLVHVDRPTDIWPRTLQISFYQKSNELWKSVESDISYEKDYQTDPTLQAFDWEKDGFIDLAVSTKNGNLICFKSLDGHYWIPDTSFFSQFPQDSLFYNPLLADFNGDGLLDLFIQKTGYYHFYENTSNEVSPYWQKTLLWSSGLDNTPHYKATIGDVNRDGLIDILFGELDGRLSYYENNGTKAQPAWRKNDEEFKNVFVSAKASPTFNNLDNDEDVDLVIGDECGRFYVYENVLYSDIRPKTKAFLPNEFSMHIYPNPFNSATTIHFELTKKQYSSLKVYNMLGQVIDVLLDQQLAEGLHKIQWKADLNSSGIYFIVLKTAEFSNCRKILYLK